MNDEFEYSYDDEFAYRPAKRQRQADKAADIKKAAAKLKKQSTSKGVTLEPAVASGRRIAKTFWGQAWNKNLERYPDFEYRLQRGRSYLHQGRVLDLKVEPGRITALVQGSYLYEVVVSIAALEAGRWQSMIKSCSSHISSAVELLTGNLPSNILATLCGPDGLFPEPKAIKFSCTCPDYADLCKHVAAGLYGLSTRLDEQPQLFFLLRQIDPQDLVKNSSSQLLAELTDATGDLDTAQLEQLFGIEINLSYQADG